MSGEASASFEMAETQPESFCRLRKTFTGYTSLNNFGCSLHLFPRAFRRKEKISYFTIKDSREWHLNGHNSNNTKEGGEKKKERVITMMSAVSLKPSAILEATFSATWLGLEQKVQVNCVIWTVTFWLKAAGNMLKEMWKLRRTYKQEQDSKLMLRLIEVRRPRKPSAPLQHKIRISATFTQRFFWTAKCSLLIF